MLRVAATAVLAVGCGRIDFDATANGGGGGGGGGGDARVFPSPCTGAGYLFCDDFDERSTVQGAWTNAYADPGGGLALETVTVASPPHAVSTSAPTLASGSSTSFLELDVPFASLTAGAIAVEYDMLAMADPATYGPRATSFTGFGEIDADNVLAARIEIGNDGGGCNTRTFAGGSPTTSVYAMPGFTSQLGAFAHVAFALKLDRTGNGTVAVTANGTSYFELDNVNTLGAASPTTLQVYMGITQNGTAGATRNYFDNVVIR